MARSLRSIYPWIQQPLVACGPMLRISQPSLATACSQAGGFGFVAGGYDTDALRKTMKDASSKINELHPKISSLPGVLPIGLGFLLFGCDLQNSVKVVQDFAPAAVWLFGAPEVKQYGEWATRVREATNGKTQVWIQVAGVREALEVMQSARPDVLVAQGADAGGHGQKQSASIISLVPELRDALSAHGFTDTSMLAAGGIVDGRGLAAALTLGADGVVMGTRFLATKEATISSGYQQEVLQTSDGGMSTIRSRLFDRIKETTAWPADYDGRAFVNRTYHDAQQGMSDEENIRLHKDEIAQTDSLGGPEARTVRYVGSGVGLVRGVVPAAELIANIREEAQRVLDKTRIGSRITE